MNKPIWRARNKPVLVRRLGRSASIGVTAMLLAGELVFGLVTYAGASATPVHPTHPRSAFWVRASPRRETITAGSTAHYRLKLRRTRVGGPVRLRVTGGVPSGASVRFSPGSTRRSRSTLIVRTSAGTPAGTYVLHVRARLGHQRRTLLLTLIVQRAAQGASATNVAVPPLTISGEVADPLEPGIPRPVDLAITNPNPLPLVLNRLTVAISALTAPQATGQFPCTLGDFAVQQYSGAYPLQIPPSSTRTLEALGLPPADWPQVAIVDQPQNQDGCQRASLTLLYTADATLG